jgi:broad specificity phosphatase PhoE
VEVWLARHGEHRAASARRIADEGLSERGEAQARRLAAALRGVPLTSCMCSPLRRARETAALVLEGRDVPLVVEESLAEGSAGDLEGLSLDEAKARHPSDFRLGETVVPRLAAAERTAPGGETRERFLGRVERAERAVRDALDGGEGALLVVSHGGLLNYLLQRLVGAPLRDEVPFGFDYCGVAKVIPYAEPPCFGPFPMVRFALPAPLDPRNA